MNEGHEIHLAHRLPGGHRGVAPGLLACGASSTQLALSTSPATPPISPVRTGPLAEARCALGVNDPVWLTAAQVPPGGETIWHRERDSNKIAASPKDSAGGVSIAGEAEYDFAAPIISPERTGKQKAPRGPSVHQWSEG
jgi:hypothetical protein